MANKIIEFLMLNYEPGDWDKQSLVEAIKQQNFSNDDITEFLNVLIYCENLPDMTSLYDTLN